MMSPPVSPHGGVVKIKWNQRRRPTGGGHGTAGRNIVAGALTNSLNFKRLRNTTGTDSVCSGFVFLILVSEPVGAANADAQTT
jgi:hypothetical protein